MKFGVLVPGLIFVLAFQGCTPKSDPHSKTSASSQGSLRASGGNPFDGKPSVYQNRDLASCSQVRDPQNEPSFRALRTEIVQEQGEFWMTVQDCRTIPARRVSQEVVVRSQSQIAFQGSSMNEAYSVASYLQSRPRFDCLGSLGRNTKLSILLINGRTLALTENQQAIERTILAAASHKLGPHPGFPNFEDRYVGSYWSENRAGEIVLYFDRNRAGVGYFGAWYFRADASAPLEFIESGACTRIEG